MTFDGNVDVVVVGERKKIGPRGMFGVENGGGREWGTRYEDLVRVVWEGQTLDCCWQSGEIVGDATSQSL